MIHILNFLTDTFAAKGSGFFPVGPGIFRAVPVEAANRVPIPAFAQNLAPKCFASVTSFYSLDALFSKCPNLCTKFDAKLFFKQPASYHFKNLQAHRFLIIAEIVL